MQSGTPPTSGSSQPTSPSSSALPTSDYLHHYNNTNNSNHNSHNIHDYDNDDDDDDDNNMDIQVGLDDISLPTIMDRSPTTTNNHHHHNNNNNNNNNQSGYMSDDSSCAAPPVVHHSEDLLTVISYTSLDELYPNQHYDDTISSLGDDDDDHHHHHQASSSPPQVPSQQQQQVNIPITSVNDQQSKEQTIENRLLKDGLKDDGELNLSREYQPVLVSNDVTGLLRFLKEFFTLGRAEKYWKQHYFFILLTLYLVSVGLLWSVLIYLIERNNMKWNWIDSMYHSFSALCLSGFLVQPIEDTRVGTQIVLFLSMLSGGIWFTALFPLLVKIRRARRRMIAKRMERVIYLRNQMTESALDSMHAHSAHQHYYYGDDHEMNDNNDHSVRRRRQRGARRMRRTRTTTPVSQEATPVENKDITLVSPTNVDTHSHSAYLSGDEHYYFNTLSDTSALSNDHASHVRFTPTGNENHQSQFTTAPISPPTSPIVDKKDLENKQQQVQQDDDLDIQVSLPASFDMPNNDSRTTSPVSVGTADVNKSSVPSTPLSPSQFSNNYGGISTLQLKQHNENYNMNQHANDVEFWEDEDAMSNYSNATHMEPEKFEQLPDNVKQYFSSANFDLKKFNPGYWPEAVKNYFTQEASYDYFESIPYTDIEYTALVWLLVLTLIFIGTVHLVAWIALAGALTNVRSKLLDKNPWWVSAFFIVSAFNNVGMAPFSDSVSRFVHNADICLIIAFVILIGNTGFPIILRLMIFTCYKFSRRYKLVFKYMLEKHHHLSLHLFPGIQTRAYLLISFALLILGVATPLIMDHNNGAYQGQPFRVQFVISFFHACSARTGGFQSIDFSVLSMASICVYLLMMRIKSQMACGLRENAYKIVDIVHQLKTDGEPGGSAPQQTEASKQLSKSLKSLSSKLKDTHSESLSIVVDMKKTEDRGVDITEKDVFSPTKRAKEFIQRLWKHFSYHTRKLMSKNNSWIALSIFIIAISESHKGINNPSMNLLRIVFEVISAFGNVGLSIGFPDTVLAFSSALNKFSKVMIVITMIAGRHRGWYASMTDQQEDEYDVNLTDRSLAKQLVRVDAKRKKKHERKNKSL